MRVLGLVPLAVTCLWSTVWRSEGKGVADTSLQREPGEALTLAPFIANTGVDNSARSSPSVDLDGKEYVPCIEPATWPVTVVLHNKASLMLASVLCTCCAVSSNLRTEPDQRTSWHLLLHEIHSKCTNNARDVL